MKKMMSGLIVLVFGICLLPSFSFALMVGQEGTLITTAKSKVVVICSTKDLYDQYTKAWVAGDEEGIRQLVFGPCLMLDSGTRILIIDSSFLLYKVRVRSGSLKGQAGWTDKSYVK